MSSHATTEVKQLVLDFFDLAFVQRKAAQAAERYLGAGYTHHDPTAPDGPEAFPALIGGLFGQAPASFHLERALAEDDHVVLHYNLQMFPGDLGQAVADIFRVEGGGSASTGTSCSKSRPSPTTTTGCSEHHATPRAAPRTATWPTTTARRAR